MRHFKAKSNSQEHVTYDLTVSDSGEVEFCTCPGFRFRSRCAHSRDLRRFLAQFEEVRKQVPLRGPTVV